MLTDIQKIIQLMEHRKAKAIKHRNNYKSTFGLETFRKEIGLLVERLNKTFTQYKIAKRFGLIEETGIQVEFYFETFK